MSLLLMNSIDGEDLKQPYVKHSEPSLSLHVEQQAGWRWTGSMLESPLQTRHYKKDC